MSGRYSRKRLLVIGVAWFTIGVFMFAAAPQFGVQASGDGCKHAPCMFPAEHYVGGFVLGADEVKGQGLHVNLDSDESPVKLPFPTKASSEPGGTKEKIVTAGLNNLKVDNFFVYKSWKYYDERTEDRRNAYLWINATPGVLKGPEGCSTNSKSNKKKCDLWASVGEISAKKFKASASVNPFGLDKTKGINLNESIKKSTKDGLITLSQKDYWLANPTKDGGSYASKANCVESVILHQNVCLGLLDLPHVLRKKVKIDSLIMDKVKFRLHDAKAVQGPDGTNKVLALNNVYAEVRYGDGWDRVYASGTNPIKPDDYPRNRTSGMSNSFKCKGNPATHADCDLKDTRNGSSPTNSNNNSPRNQSYINIYR